MGPRLYLAGIDKPEQARAFLTVLRRAAEDADMNALTGLTRLPFKTYDKGRVVRDFRAHADLAPHARRLFNSRVLQGIREARYESPFVNDQGAMLGDGEPWFDGVDGEIRIKAVNPREP